MKRSPVKQPLPLRSLPRVPLHERASGLLLHPTSLPGPHGCGDLGPAALRFLEQLVAGGQRWWQMLPVGPTGYGNSPYSALSAFAGNPLLVSPDLLVSEELLVAADLDAEPSFPLGEVDFAVAGAWRERLLRLAFERFACLPDEAPLRARFAAFRKQHADWLDDFALYAALKQRAGGVEWTRWEAPLRARRPRALAEARRELQREIDFHSFAQFLFDLHWGVFQEAAARRGVGLIGDLPIFVAHDSADVWAHPELFQLDEEGNPTVIAGVPPDYFSQTGQRWGNPLYRWKAHRETNYAWWSRRFALLLARFDAVRLDHFIGFERYWEIPADEPTAINGRWVPGPGAHFFRALEEQLGELPLIAEDLGAVTPEVTALRERFGFPGLRILQFAFGTDPQAPTFKPHNYPRRTVVYTGTHDNDTTAGWYHDPGGEGTPRSAEQAEKERVFARAYLGSSGREIHWDFIRAVEASTADLAIVPVQDLLGLGSEARMNRPGVAGGNWQWRLQEGQLGRDVLERLQQLGQLYDRTAPHPLPVPAERPVEAPAAKRAAAKRSPARRPPPKRAAKRPTAQRSPTVRAASERPTQAAARTVKALSRTQKKASGRAAKTTAKSRTTRRGR